AQCYPTVNGRLSEEAGPSPLVVFFSGWRTWTCPTWPDLLVTPGPVALQRLCAPDRDCLETVCSLRIPRQTARPLLEASDLVLRLRVSTWPTSGPAQGPFPASKSGQVCFHMSSGGK